MPTIAAPRLPGYLEMLDTLKANLLGRASESQIQSIINQAGEDTYRGAGGRLTRQQARAQVEPDIRNVAAKNNAEADQRMMLLAGAAGIALVAWLSRGRR